MYVVGHREFEQELKDIDGLISDMRVIAEFADIALESSAKTFGLENKKDADGYDLNYYKNPLYEFHKEIHNKREDSMVRIAKFAIERWTKLLVPNIKTSLEEVIEQAQIKDADGYKREMWERDLKPGFKAEWLMDLFKKKYIGDAVRLSQEEILKMARKLVYRIQLPNYELRDAIVADILNKQTLKLQKHMTGYGESLEREETVIGMVKLARIVIQGENPVTVNADIRLFDYKNFKNGRFDAKFNSEEDAKAVAEVLINGFPQADKKKKTNRVI